ncbi:NAD-dependent protein deacetylase hst1 [Hypsizygus marmoreus]|uniref:NAD-dependent protein deacetylase hst1 n=1 Tax=Hypsizygus marmoreus TaxID=39966 RepID=A0A369JAC4_HYPMA|nr:NAD-dependent protein deacetylase hst1 [Hypsizygus marmoreus]
MASSSASDIPVQANEGLEPTRTLRALTSHEIFVLQVRAFLEAAEDVDIDPETVEDLMQSIPNDFPASEEFVGPGRIIDPAEDSDSDENVNFPEEELDISALYSVEDDAQQTWTEREVKQMMHHLKERGMVFWIKEYVLTRNVPIPKLLRAFGISLCEQLQNKKPTTLLYFLKVALSRELRLRDRLPQYNTISDAVNLIRSSRRILILTGAGISVSCGIPDFRSRDGLYASLKDRGEYDLDDPQQMFDITYFRENPAVFYSFASQIYPSNFIPSPCHRFIKLIEEKNQLLRNYTQNIDTLETLAGVQRVLQCHGSFATASCLLCRRRVSGSEIEADIMRQKVPLCTVCKPPAAPPPKKKKQGKKKTKGAWDSEDEDESDQPAYPPGIMKPDITFFGEKLTDAFDKSLAEDREQVDLLLVIGTSLKVSPVAEILSHLPHSVPQILINKTPIRHINPDIVLLGNADEIVQYLCTELEWELPPPATLPPPSSTVRPRLPRGDSKKDLRTPEQEGYVLKAPQRVGDSHVWLFDGAEGGRWLQELRRELAAAAQIPPSVPVSGTSTRFSSPGPGASAGETSTVYRKREFLDVNEEERVMKKVRSDRGSVMGRQ